MRCALASKGFINGDLQHNKNVIVNTMLACSGEADIIIFGEAFLQGFYGVTFDIEHDVQIALSQNDSIVKEICAVAKQSAIAVSFGFIEKEKGCFYSSQITIDKNGNILDVYRRVSPGWKESFAEKSYCEGDAFHAFFFMGNKIAVGLCGDFWFDENIDKVIKLKPDVVFWPVYTDYNYNEWNTSVKYEYAFQAGKICKKVLYVNSFCKDMDGEEIAKGGAAFFENGTIQKEVLAGNEAILFVEI